MTAAADEYDLAMAIANGRAMSAALSMDNARRARALTEVPHLCAGCKGARLIAPQFGQVRPCPLCGGEGVSRA